MGISALNVAALSMIVQDKIVHNLANNVANSNTTAFKSGIALLSDLMYQTEKRMGGSLGGGGEDLISPTGIQFGTGSKIEAIVKDFRQGALIETGEDLHVAIKGEGFFIINLPDGTLAYARDGAFTTNSMGQITTAAGYVVSPTIEIPSNTRKLSIKYDGNVYADLPGDTEQQLLGQIQLAQFVNKGGLESIGGNLYRETDASGPARVGNPGEENFGVLYQNKLEASNVDAITQVTDLIKAQRIYEISSRVLHAIDHMLKNISDAKA